mmetsp:Transcript_2648/g.6537  ORF Transcript_2648/g.6537 Transcript_2648/m.6537 type:complete len:253 (-) Transcript_2648:128-886(-)
MDPLSNRKLRWFLLKPVGVPLTIVTQARNRFPQRLALGQALAQPCCLVIVCGLQALSQDLGLLGLHRQLIVEVNDDDCALRVLRRRVEGDRRHHAQLADVRSPEADLDALGAILAHLGLSHEPLTRLLLHQKDSSSDVLRPVQDVEDRRRSDPERQVADHAEPPPVGLSVCLEVEVKQRSLLEIQLREPSLQLRACLTVELHSGERRVVLQKLRCEGAEAWAELHNALAPRRRVLQGVAHAVDDALVDQKVL